MQTVAINSAREFELEEDRGYIHVMKYMGSKRELLSDIRAAVQTLLPDGGGVLDLFAGTCSVGACLKDDYSVASNDIQAYSRIIADALITSGNQVIEKNSGKSLAALEVIFQKHLRKLERLFPETLKASNAFVTLSQDSWTSDLHERYLDFFRSFPSPLNEFTTPSAELVELKNLFLERSATAGRQPSFDQIFIPVVPSPAPYCQTAFLFPETYFSFSQCLQIDSLRYAIDQHFGANPMEHAIALTALIYAHSYCSSGTGHFAMFRDLDDLDSVKDVFLYRKRSVWDYFSRKFGELVAFHRHTSGLRHSSHSLSFEDILGQSQVMERVDLIYADPPYSFVHYSRFYHATESLVRYDYMMPKFKGRYRTDRHQSPFCQVAHVKGAFEDLFRLSASHLKHVLLSYSDTGMIPLEQILSIAAGNGYECSVREVDYKHSTMGRKGHKANSIKEYLVLARFAPVV